jgi:sulfhydrogenase subunit beta (sulfur reductase)
MKKIAKVKLEELWGRLAAEQDLFLPVQMDSVVNFALWKEGARVNLEAVNSLLPPKDLLFPQSEKIFSYRRRDGELTFEEAAAGGPQVVFGIRPCDVRSIELLDPVFLKEPVDTFYKNRREQTTLVSIGCLKPDTTCFCTAFGIQPLDARGADMMLYDMGTAYLVSSRTEKGEKLEEEMGDLLEEAAGAELEGLKQQEEAAASAQEHGVNLEGVSEKLNDMFDHCLWDQFYRRCLGCGTCTYLCPTCHCFDIQDDGSLERGLRFRCWDSCMYEDYTLMGHGHNPRPGRRERVRNRFMHKLNYFPKEHDGLYHCVGCGRCVAKCPVNLDIMQVIKEVSKVAGGEGHDR